MKLTITFQGRTQRGTVHDSSISKEGVHVEAAFPDHASVLMIGDSVETRLEDPKSRNACVANARVIRVVKDGDSTAVGLMYTLEDLPRVRAVLYGRTSVRVGPSVALPLSVQVDGNLTLQVFDISIGGIAFVMGEEEQKRVTGWAFPFKLRLATHPQELDLWGAVKERRLSGATVIYAMEFDERKTQGLEQKQDIIHQYVMQRQTEMLRQQAKYRAA